MDRDEHEHQPDDPVNDRTGLLLNSIRQLFADREVLEAHVQFLEAIYSESAINENIHTLKQYTNDFIQDVIQIANVNTHPLWLEVRDMIREAISQYKGIILRSHEYAAYEKQKYRLRTIDQTLSELRKLDVKLPSETPGSSSEHNRHYHLNCPVCMDARVDTSLKCGHLLCQECAQRNNILNCPVCRAPIQSDDFRRIYI